MPRDHVRAVLGVLLGLGLIVVAAVRLTPGEDTVRPTGADTQPRIAQRLPSSADAGGPDRGPVSVHAYGHLKDPAGRPARDRSKDKARRSDLNRSGRPDNKHMHQGKRPGKHQNKTKKVHRRTHHRHQKPSEPVVQETPPAQFRVASFNVLGASHTSRGGNKPRFAAGATRMRSAVQLLRAHGIDVAGLQEFEISQFAAFRRLAGGQFSLFPGASMGRNPVRNSIAWRNDTWSLVSAHTIPVPYFHGHRVPMPYVLLQHRQSGRQVYFINVHNPASTKKWGNNEHWRDVATTMQIALVRRLIATDTPVVFTGDFNERTEAFCRITAATPLHAANGGSTGGPCRPPGNHGIDWIFGSGSVSFSGYLRQRTGLVGRVTDHPLILSGAQIG